MKQYLKLFLISGILIGSFAFSYQNEPGIKFVDGRNLTVLGRAAGIDKGCYRRIDSLHLKGLPEAVKNLSTNSSGIQIMFRTNSRRIDVHWKLRKYIIRPNLTPVEVDGLDLYGWNGHAWQFVASAMPKSEDNSDSFIQNLDGKMRQYKVYLPLYAELTNIEIGVDNDADISPVEPEYLPSKKVVIYGSSITQGASASRPGMAYPSIMGRMLFVEPFNLGFSGSGKMEPELVDVLAHMPADLYILDCVPNPSPEQINQRAIPFIRRLRDSKPGVPILMVESIFRETGNWSSKMKSTVTQQNQAFKDAYNALKKEGFTKLYYIPSNELLGSDHDATVDGTHPNDIGQRLIAERIGKEVAKILKL